ncbi:ExbD/TolR family protein [Pleionea mediterranea]|uniref:Biopolymer transport protein ExbD/TolR n=1 Tax=Pleionea mediterranea TaxID=523701 RepID=A0A316FUA3_9GAMM|nr:biopolymer transporter ExbD [Pleionea mediterranea]PWK51963.1 biopolymer transport protein ExbD/TolR [Pleionea mediterranea]
MKRIATQQQTSDIDMTPMLDIVFIMLIFFIVIRACLSLVLRDVES